MSKPALYKIVFATHHMGEYSDVEIRTAMLLAAHLKRGEFWLFAEPAAQTA
jgi:hypothetical protein